MGDDDWKGEGIIRNVPRDNRSVTNFQARANAQKAKTHYRECEAEGCSVLIPRSTPYRFCLWHTRKMTDEGMKG